MGMFDVEHKVTTRNSRTMMRQHITRHHYGRHHDMVNLVVTLNIVIFTLLARKYGLENVGYNDIEFACI
jgi:hypothetical protein